MLDFHTYQCAQLRHSPSRALAARTTKFSLHDANGAGPVVLIRTELDALPVNEKTGLPYASTVKRKTTPAISERHACLRATMFT